MGISFKAYFSDSIYNKAKQSCATINIYKLRMRINTLSKSLLSFGLVLSFAFVSLAPFSAHAQSVSGACTDLGDSGLDGVVECLISIFGDIIMVLIAASVVYVVYGAFLMISNEEKREDGKKIIYHGIIGLFVMISIWGLVNILDNTFNLSDYNAIEPPALRN